MSDEKQIALDKQKALDKLINLASERSQTFANKITYWQQRNKPVDIAWLLKQLKSALSDDIIMQALTQITENKQPNNAQGASNGL